MGRRSSARETHFFDGIGQAANTIIVRLSGTIPIHSTYPFQVGMYMRDIDEYLELAAIPSDLIGRMAFSFETYGIGA